MINVYLLFTLHVYCGTCNDGADHCIVSESLADKAATLLNISRRKGECRETWHGPKVTLPFLAHWPKIIIGSRQTSRRQRNPALCLEGNSQTPLEQPL